MSLAPGLMICDDCEHEHGGAPHGFCHCGCTFPGWHWVPVADLSPGEGGPS